MRWLSTKKPTTPRVPPPGTLGPTQRLKERTSSTVCLLTFTYQLCHVCAYTHTVLKMYKTTRSGSSVVGMSTCCFYRGSESGS